MTDLEISKALAIAIGWRYVYTTDSMCLVDTFNARNKAKVRGAWLVGCRVFDYRDWNVIGPIAQKFDCFPFWHQNKGEPYAWHTFDIETGNKSTADTPQKAIALAVIQGAKK
jgi:hypothetical protein